MQSHGRFMLQLHLFLWQRRNISDRKHFRLFLQKCRKTKENELEKLLNGKKCFDRIPYCLFYPLLSEFCTYFFFLIYINVINLLLFYCTDDKMDFFNFRYLQFRHGRLRSRLDKTHAKSSIYLRQSALTRPEGKPRAILPPTFGGWDGSSSRAFTRRIVCKSLAA